MTVEKAMSKSASFLVWFCVYWAFFPLISKKNNNTNAVRCSSLAALFAFHCGGLIKFLAVCSISIDGRGEEGRMLGSFLYCASRYCSSVVGPTPIAAKLFNTIHAIWCGHFFSHILVLSNQYSKITWRFARNAIARMSCEPSATNWVCVDGICCWILQTRLDKHVLSNWRCCLWTSKTFKCICHKPNVIEPRMSCSRSING